MADPSLDDFVFIGNVTYGRGVEWRLAEILNAGTAGTRLFGPGLANAHSYLNAGNYWQATLGVYSSDPTDVLGVIDWAGEGKATGYDDKDVLYQASFPERVTLRQANQLRSSNG